MIIVYWKFIIYQKRKKMKSNYESGHFKVIAKISTTYIYIYIYIEKERERERKKE